MPDIPDYQIVRKIGEGAYGEIWLGISVTGVYRAIKFIRRDKFEHERPYEREFNGIKQYEPVSREHDGLVDILHIGRNEEEGYFYYVMELSDDQHTGQEIDPATYKPKTLRSELTARENLPIPECLEQGAHLARALAHLHACGLAHRDVKPANIIYVKGKPRLADIGLVKALDDSVSFAGTIGYVPLEGPGRPTGDVFSLGKVLYEMLTGMDRTEFPSLPDSFKDDTRPGLQKLNQIVFKACEHKPDKRYQKADQLAVDLEQLIGQDLTTGSAPAVGSLPVGKLVAALAAVALVIFGINQFKDMKSTGEEKSQPVVSGVEDKYAHLKEGLIAYYPFNGNANDESGNKNNGEVKGPTLTTGHDGKENGAYKFSHGDDYIDIPNHPSLSLTTNMTISVWLKIDSLQDADGWIISKGWLDELFDPSDAKEYEGARNGIKMNISRYYGCLIARGFSLSDGVVHDLDGGGRVPFKEGIPFDGLPLKRFFHVTYTFDGEYFRAYKDGVFFAISNKMQGTLNAQKGNIQIGQIKDLRVEQIKNSYHASFKGVADNVRLYNRALSDQEVKDLHEMEKPQPKTVASVGSKATTPGTFDLADLVEKNGIYHHKDTDKPVTGRMNEYLEGKKYRETNLKGGIRHGTYIWWMVDNLNRLTGTKFRDEIYHHGRVVKYREWEAETGEQRVLEMWNEAGTPKDRLAPVNATEDSTLKTWNKAELIEKDGVAYHKETDQRVTGRVVWFIEGKIYREYILKDGIHDGYHRWWSVRNRDGKEVVTSSLHRDEIYKEGQLIRHKSWTAYPEGKRVVKEAWNGDGTPTNPKDGKRSLVAYYPFNGNANDESGYGNNAQVKGATLIPDRHGIKGSAYDFDGKDDYIEVAAMSPSPNAGNSSMTLWVKISKEKKGQLISIGAPKCGFFIHPQKGYLAARFTSSAAFPGDYTVDSNSVNQGNKQFNCPEDEWAQLCMVWHGTFNPATVYVNGKEATIDNSIKRGKGDVGGQFLQGDNYFTFPAPLRIGDDINFQSMRPPIAPFKGSIDDVRIYNRALSADEVKELHEMEKPKSILDKGLIAYYPFNGNAKDESGNENHAENKGALPAEDRHGEKGMAMTTDGAAKDAVVNLGKVMAGKTTCSISIWYKTNERNSQALLTTRKIYKAGAIILSANAWFAEWSYYPDNNYLAIGTRNKGQRLNNDRGKGWDHVVLTVTDVGKEIVSIYLHGRLVTKGGSDSQLRKILNEDLLLSPDRTNERFHGSFDDLRLYDRALSAEEVAELHEMEKPKSVLEKGLVAYYPFNGNAKDESGNGNDGEVNGAGVIVDGKAQFDGSNYITAKATRLPQGKSARTLSFWAVSTDPDMEWGAMVGWGDPLIKHASFGSYIGSGHFGFLGWGTDTGDVNVSPSDEQVHHHSVTHNGDMISYYIDGKQIRTFKVGPRVTGGTVLAIGARIDEEYGFKGTIDEVRIYDRALSKEEINELYNLEKPKSDLEKGLVAYYPFNADATDESGNGNHGRVEGATGVADRHGKEVSAYSFDGKDDFIVVPEAAGFEANMHTISVWVYMSEPQGRVILGKDSNDGTQGTTDRQWMIQTRLNGKILGHIWTSEGMTEHYSTGIPEIKRWNQIVQIWDGKTQSLYINGVLDSSTPAKGNLNAGKQPLQIGVDSALKPKGYFTGMIDDVRIYDRALSKEEIKELYNREKPKLDLGAIRSFAGVEMNYQVNWSPDGKLLASGSTDNTVRVWDAVTGKELRVFEGHESPVECVSWSPDGKMLASGGKKHITIWDYDDRKILHKMKGKIDGVWKLSWSPDGKLLASGGGSFDNVIEIWNTENGELAQVLKGHTADVTSVAWSPDGKYIASTSIDTSVKIWNASTGKDIQTLKGEWGWGMDVAWSPDGKQLARSSWDHSIKVWDSATWKEVRNLTGHTSHVHGISWDPSSKFLVSASRDNTLKIWDVAISKDTYTLKGHDNWVLGVHWSPNGKWIASGSFDKTVKVWAVPESLAVMPKVGLDKGLVAYYPFNGNAKDESGNGNDGKVNGAASVADRHGKKESAYSFSVEKNSYIEVPTSNASPWSHARTISLWLKFQGVARGIPIRNYADNAGSEIKWDISCLKNKDASTTVHWMCNPFRPANIGRGVSSGPMVLSPDEWFKLTVLNKDEGVELYLNGEFIASSMGKVQLNEITPNSYPLLIGGWMQPGLIQGRFDGEIDDVRIYNRALSKVEVEELYSLEKPKPVITPNNPKAKAAIEGAIRKAAGKPTGDLTKEDFEKVTKLNIDRQNISDISALKDLKQLQVLNISHNPTKNISALEGLNQLWSLDAFENQISDVSALKGMKKLRVLKLTTNQVRDLTPLKDLTQLEELFLEHNDVSDLSPLYGLKNLRGLYIQNNPNLTKAEIEKLRKALPGLITVINTATKVIPNSPAAKAKIEGAIRTAAGKPEGELTQTDYEKVTALVLKNKQLTDVKSLEKLTQLTSLNLDNNQLTDVKGLEKLTRLRVLNLANNPALTKAQIDELQKALPKCKITHNAKK